MSTAEALHVSEEGEPLSLPATDSWPEGLPADATELASELDRLQRACYEREGLRGSPVPANIIEITQEVRRLTYATGPFPQAIAQDLATDMGKLRAFYRERSANGNHRGPETAQG
jgi:hypothetical protein